MKLLFELAINSMILLAIAVFTLSILPVAISDFFKRKKQRSESLEAIARQPPQAVPTPLVPYNAQKIYDKLYPHQCCKACIYYACLQDGTICNAFHVPTDYSTEPNTCKDFERWRSPTS